MDFSLTVKKVVETQYRRKAILDIPGATIDGMSRERLQAEYAAVNKFLGDADKTPIYDKGKNAFLSRNGDEASQSLEILSKFKIIADGGFLTKRQVRSGLSSYPVGKEGLDPLASIHYTLMVEKSQYCKDFLKFCLGDENTNEIIRGNDSSIREKKVDFDSRIGSGEIFEVVQFLNPVNEQDDNFKAAGFELVDHRTGILVCTYALKQVKEAEIDLSVRKGESEKAREQRVPYEAEQSGLAEISKLLALLFGPMLQTKASYLYMDKKGWLNDMSMLDCSGVPGGANALWISTK